MPKFLATYLVALVLFLVLDGLWLGVVARGFYVEQIGHLMRDRPLILPAAIFYLLFVGGLVHFAVSDALAVGSVSLAAVDGALFGFCAYLTFNATSLSVIRGYPVTAAVVDTLWGAVLGALVAALTVATLTRLG